MTNAIVSITRHGKMFMKIVAGCNSMKAPKLAKAIQYSPERVFAIGSLAGMAALALQYGLGCKDCLIVVGEEGILQASGSDEKLSPLYRSTFKYPDFNPR